MSQAIVITKGQRMSTYFSPPPLHYIGTVVYTENSISQLPMQMAVAKKIDGSGSH